ncbi:Sec-independent protein translocase protein TatB [Microvirga sp. 2MCAF38]|uniref:Sec-independent protein translocase protein TatB n=1 Tax=Microvirga sp. 2MCAF38 TaxID=3232989 RepID=UPI003F9D9CF4
MLDMSWGEVMVIGAVALIVIGPKDLPKALRTVGNVTGKIRRMAAEFQGQFHEAMREAELDDVKRELQGMNDSVSSMNKGFNPIQTIRDELKGAVEAPVSTPPTVTGEAVAEPAPSGEATPPAPVDPLLSLELPSVPPIPDPAETIAATLRQEAEAKALQENPAPEPKPDAKA